jgi:hypothetical protein
MGGREGLMEREGKQRGEKGGREWERNLYPPMFQRNRRHWVTRPNPHWWTDSSPVDKAPRPREFSPAPGPAPP